jgi:hypothetical protein
LPNNIVNHRLRFHDDGVMLQSMTAVAWQPLLELGAGVLLVFQQLLVKLGMNEC